MKELGIIDNVQVSPGQSLLNIWPNLNFPYSPIDLTLINVRLGEQVPHPYKSRTRRI